MGAFFYGLLTWASASLVGRVLVGAGLTLVVYAGVGTAVEAVLETAVAHMVGLPAEITALAYLSGVGVAVSILGSALLARVSLSLASRVVGVRAT